MCYAGSAMRLDEQPLEGFDTKMCLKIVMHPEETSEDYFLAGRGLKWWLIGFSLIAANISAEQFIGMSGKQQKIQ